MRGPRALSRRIGMGRAAGAREVNVGWTNRSECNEQWEAKRGSDQEHRLVRQQISNQAHEPCRDQRSGGSETLIAPQLPGQSQMTDYAKADGSNRWPKECTRGSVEHQGSENHRKVRPNSNSECGDSNHDGAERCESPLRADCIQQFATRHEGKQASETARGKDQADILLSPFLLSQINGYIGTKTSQHGRIEEIDSVKTVQARTRWRGFTSMGQRHNECHLLTSSQIKGSTGSARERHGLFRCGAFAAARLHAHRSKNIRERYSDHVPPGPNTWTLNVQPLGRFRPHRSFLLARSALPSSVTRLLHTAG